MTDPPPLPAFSRPSLMADLRWWADHLPQGTAALTPGDAGLQRVLQLAAETLTQAEAQIAALIAERDRARTMVKELWEAKNAQEARADAAEASAHKWMIDFGMKCKSLEAERLRADAAEAALRTLQPQRE